MAPAADRALAVAAFSGMPVVRVGRGNTGGDTPRIDPVGIAGSNLSATKARLLLMACLLKFGSVPPAVDPEHPTDTEITVAKQKVAEYQQVFDTHWPAAGRQSGEQESRRGVDPGRRRSWTV